MTLAEVIRAGMELSPAEREEAAHVLLESIEGGADQAGVNAVWAEEFARRAEDLESGQVAMMTREQLDAFLDERAAARRV